MIKRELEILRETERKCRELLAQAERERLEILRDAKREARLRREALTQAAHEEGMRHLHMAAEQETAARAARLAQWEDQVALTWDKGRRRMEDAVHAIFEGMWESGDRTDDQLQPDDA